VVGLKAYQDGFHDLATKELRAFLAAAPQDPRRPEVLYVLAQSELARKDWAGARSALDELVVLPGPRAREGRFWMGWLDAREGKSAPALGHLEGYLAEPVGERRTEALFLAGELARKLGTGSAVAHFAAFLEAAPKDPRRPSAWLGLVQAREKTDAAGAVAAARRGAQDPVVKADAAALEALALAGVEAARGAGDPAAEASFWQVLGQKARGKDLKLRARYEEGAVLLRAGDQRGAREALEAYLKAASQGPHAVRAHLLLADLEQGAGQGGAALAHLEQALVRADDPAVALRRRELERAALGLALAGGDRARAAGHARSLLTANGPGHPEDQSLAHFTLGAVATDPAEALSQWDAVPAGTSRYRESRLLAARALLESERAAEALSRLTPLLAAPDPESAVHLTALAAAEGAGDHRRASELAGWLAERPPPGGTRAEFLQRRAVSLQAAGDDGAYAQALEELAAAAPGNPRGAWAAAELGGRAFDRGEWETVLRWATAARAGADPSALAFQEAEALFRLGRTEDARTAFAALGERAGPGQALALARLGGILDQTGDHEGAIQAYRRALAVGIEGEVAEWVRGRLSALEAGEPAVPE